MFPEVMDTTRQFSELAFHLPISERHAGFGEPVCVRAFALPSAVPSAMALLGEVAARARYGDWLLFMGGEAAPPLARIDDFLRELGAALVAFCERGGAMTALAVRAGLLREALQGGARLAREASLATLAAQLVQRAPLVAVVDDGRDLVRRGPPDTAVVTALYGGDPRRRAANVAGLRGQLLQDLPVDHYVVELIAEGEKTCLPEDLSRRVLHVPVYGGDATGDLFQKEALLNLGWRHARARHPYNHFIFTDADVMALRYDWWRLLRARLREREGMVVQGLRVAYDSGDKWYRCLSTAAYLAGGMRTDLLLSDGFAFGINHALLARIDGLNPYSIDGCGDSTFIGELFPELGRVVAHDSLRWFAPVRRALDVTVELDYLPVDLVHLFHGKLTERNYAMVALAIEAFDKPLSELITLDESGVLAWRDPRCREREILRQRALMRSRAKVEEIFASAGHPWPARLRQAFAPATEPELCLLDKLTHLTPKGQSRVFELDACLVGAYPWSFGEGVETRGPLGGLPLRADGADIWLELLAKDEVELWRAGIALAPGYIPCSLAGMRSLFLCVKLPPGAAAQLELGLGSRLADGRLVQSSFVTRAVSSRGAAPCEVTVDLSEFMVPESFDPERVETLLFACARAESLSITRVRLSPEPAEASALHLVSSERAGTPLTVSLYGFASAATALEMTLDGAGVPVLELAPAAKSAAVAFPFGPAWPITSLERYMEVELELMASCDDGGELRLVAKCEGERTVALAVLGDDELDAEGFVRKRVSLASLDPASSGLLRHARALELELTRVRFLAVRTLVVVRERPLKSFAFISSDALAARLVLAQSAGGGVVTHGGCLPVGSSRERAVVNVRVTTNGAWVLLAFNREWTALDLSRHHVVLMTMHGRHPPAPRMYIDCDTERPGELVSIPLLVSAQRPSGKELMLCGSLVELTPREREALRRARQLKLVYYDPCEVEISCAEVCVDAEKSSA